MVVGTNYNTELTKKIDFNASYRFYPDIAVRTGGEISWAFRKNSPKLKAVVNEFVKGHKKGTMLGLLKMLLDQCRSLRYNPFYDYVYQRSMEWFPSEDTGETASSFRQH